MTLAPLIRFSRASPPSRHRSMSHRFPRAPLYLNCLPQCSTSTLEALPDMSLTPVAPLYLNCLPQCSTSTLEALPDMSLTPVAPLYLNRLPQRSTSTLEALPDMSLTPSRSIVSQ